MPVNLRKQLFRGLHVQLLLLVIVPTAITLMIVAFRGTALHEQAMREVIGERDARATQAAADNLEERLHQRETTLALTASLMGESPLSELYITELSTLFDYGLILAQPEGEVLDTWLPAGGWEWREAPGGTPAYVGHSDSEVLIVFSVPISSGNTYLYGATSLKALGIVDLLQSLITSQASAAYLVDEDGHLLFSTHVEQIGHEMHHIPAVMAALRGGTGFQQGNEHAKHMVIGYSAVPRLGWALIIQEPWHTVSTPQLRVSHSALLVTVSISLLVLLVIAFGALNVVRPLQRLQTQAGRLVNGDYNAIFQPVGGIQEIADLQHALIQMSQAIQQAQGRLHEYIGVITTAQEDERHRLARELHDDVVQTLIALNQQAQKAQRSMEKDTGTAVQRLGDVRQLSEQVVQDIRQLIHDLRPTYLRELGLIPALEMLTEQERSLPMQYKVEGEVRRLPDHIELAVYRITQEALNNIRKHSHATKASVTLCFTSDSLDLTIRDNGKGFDIPPLQRLPVKGHYGLLGIQERAQLINAHLEMSSASQQGTILRLHVPLSV